MISNKHNKEMRGGLLFLALFLVRTASAGRCEEFAVHLSCGDDTPVSLYLEDGQTQDMLHNEMEERAKASNQAPGNCREQSFLMQCAQVYLPCHVDAVHREAIPGEILPSFLPSSASFLPQHLNIRPSSTSFLFVTSFLLSSTSFLPSTFHPQVRSFLPSSILKSVPSELNCLPSFLTFLPSFLLFITVVPSFIAFLPPSFLRPALPPAL
jgi:hypothetical protein